MRFRNAQPKDFPACIELLRQDGGFEASDTVWDSLESLWLKLYETQSFASFQVFETQRLGGRSDIIGFRNSAFVTKEFEKRYLASPHAQVAAQIWRSSLAGQSPLLNRKQIASSNARSELCLVVLHWCVRHRNPLHPQTLRLLTILPSAWQLAHFGYRCRMLIAYEMFGPEAVRIMRNIGYLQHSLTDQEKHADSTVFYWDIEQHHMGQGALVAIACSLSPDPVFGFTAAEQRLLMLALDGQADRELAESLGTVKLTCCHLPASQVYEVNRIATWCSITSGNTWKNCVPSKRPRQIQHR
jgi:hypothetical protein